MPEYRVPVQGALMVEGATPAEAARSATQWCTSFGQTVRGQGAQHEVRGGYLETDAREVTEISGETIQLEFFDPREEIVTLLQQRATRTVA